MRDGGRAPAGAGLAERSGDRSLRVQDYLRVRMLPTGEKKRERAEERITGGMNTRKMKTEDYNRNITDYETFLTENHRRVNLLLNKFLRFSVLIGPLLMLAIRFGIFHSVSYKSCIIVTVLLVALCGIHYLLIRREENTTRAAIIAFLAIDIMLILMNSAHIGIYMTWFVVPLISLLFCDYKIYAIAVVINYCIMTLSVWIVSPYYAGLRVDFDSPFQYFAGRMGGFTIETLIMVAAGYSLCRISTSHYQELIEKFQILRENKRQMDEQVRISMTDELTGVYNRRCFDTDIEQYREKEPEENFVLFSVDVNGLKETNDTRGHLAGDELLIATADCLTKVIGMIGKVYRTGGDEFLAIAGTDAPEEILEEINRLSAAWHGKYEEKLSLSIGYASHREHPEADIQSLENLADQMMYREKDRYYSTPGLDRRRTESREKGF